MSTTTTQPTINKNVQEDYNKINKLVEEANKKTASINCWRIVKISGFLASIIALGSLAVWTFVNSLGLATSMILTIPIVALTGTFLLNKLAKKMQNSNPEKEKEIFEKVFEYKSSDPDIKIKLTKEQGSFVSMDRYKSEPIDKTNERYQSIIDTKAKPVVKSFWNWRSASA